ncbi:MAG: hypothetical protein U9R19_18400 [Bacteroidota bacterium]|nr:hypothetical protein [Bacteroidota bacterium]
MKKLLFILPMLLLFSGLFFQSCVDPDPPKAVVSVFRVDINDEQWPVPNCEVRLDIPEGTSQPELIEFASKPKLTDINGQVEYVFKYEGIITVVAKKGDGAESCGQGVLILKEDEVYQEDIRLSACEDL